MTSINRLMVLEPGDDAYKLFHGAVWLDSDKATWNYRWGGLQCKGRDLSDTSIQLLFAAFRSEYQVAMEFVTSEYKGKQFRCVTGYDLEELITSWSTRSRLADRIARGLRAFLDRDRCPACSRRPSPAGCTWCRRRTTEHEASNAPVARSARTRRPHRVVGLDARERHRPPASLARRSPRTSCGTGPRSRSSSRTRAT